MAEGILGYINKFMVDAPIPAICGSNLIIKLPYIMNRKLTNVKQVSAEMYSWALVFNNHTSTNDVTAMITRCRVHCSVVPVIGSEEGALGGHSTKEKALLANLGHIHGWVQNGVPLFSLCVRCPLLARSGQ